MRPKPKGRSGRTAFRSSPSLRLCLEDSVCYRKRLRGWEHFGGTCSSRGDMLIHPPSPHAHPTENYSLFQWENSWILCCRHLQKCFMSLVFEICPEPLGRGKRLRTNFAVPTQLWLDHPQSAWGMCPPPGPWKPARTRDWMSCLPVIQTRHPTQQGTHSPKQQCDD